MMDISAIQSLIRDDMQAVDALIHHSLRSDVALVNQLGHYIVNSGGKRLRPVLVLLSAQLFGYKAHDHINLAAVVFPRPASPLSRAALELMVPDGIKALKFGFTSLLFPRIWISYHTSSHSLRCFICECCPIIYSELFGLYFSVQGTEIPTLFTFVGFSSSIYSCEVVFFPEASLLLGFI